ncbi:hypothetical protein llg_29380 [Luteolibacter sp. LG18]|nr:hypothetical protein llg_29380 [Luteolibacter sp. LG18]
MVSPALAGVDLTFDNLSGLPPAEVHVMFGGMSTADFSGTCHGQALEVKRDYTLADFGGQPVTISRLWGGKIFISYGAGLIAGSPHPGYPDFQPLSGDPATKVRWDKIELSYWDGHHSGVNLSAADFYSIPMAVTTTRAGAPVKSIGWSKVTPSRTVYRRLVELTDGSATQSNCLVEAAGTAIPYGVSVPVNGVEKKLVRIISPANVRLDQPNPYPAIAVPVGSTAWITGTYGGVGGNATATLPGIAYAWQTYDFTSRVAANGDLMLTGSGSLTGNVVLTVKAGDVAQGMYSSAPPYYLSSTGSLAHDNTNCVYDAVLSDVIAAYNLGLVSTTTPDPRPQANVSGLPMGTMTSDAWFSRGPQYGLNPQLKPAWLFGFLQADPARYNRYASYLSSVTDAYSFPYTDKTAAPFLELLTPGQEATAPTGMTITLLPDDPSTLTYEGWKTAHFGAAVATPATSGDLADPDGDGLENLLEYVLGTDPLVAGPGFAASSYFSSGTVEWTCDLNAGATGIQVSVEGSADLQTWTDVAAECAVLSNQDGVKKVKFTVRTGGALRQMFRLKARR